MIDTRIKTKLLKIVGIDLVLLQTVRKQGTLKILKVRLLIKVEFLHTFILLLQPTIDPSSLFKFLIFSTMLTIHSPNGIILMQHCTCSRFFVELQVCVM